MAGRFTAGVATGILIVGLAGVVVAATHIPSTSAAGPSGTTNTSRNGASQSKAGGSASRLLSPNAGRLSSGSGGDPGTGFMMVGKVGLLTVTAINGQTITATLGGGPGLGAGPFMIGKPGVGIGIGGARVVTPPLGSAAPVTPPQVTPPLGSVAPVTVTIDVSSTTVYTRAGQPAGLSDIQVGSVLSVQGTWTGNNTITASAIEIVLPQRTGVVTAINGNTLTMTGMDARTYTITVGSDTTYRRADQTAALSDVAVGSLISAEGTLSSDGSTLNALQVTIQLPHVFGQVTAVNGNTVTVQGPDGTTSTVQLTDTTTYSAKPQGTATRSSITTGSFIMAEGTLGSDGTLTALHVDIATGVASGMGKGIGLGVAPPPGAITSHSGGATTSAGPLF